MKKLSTTFLIIILTVIFNLQSSKAEVNVTCNFSVNGGSLTSGYKFWKSPPIPSNYYSVNLQISSFSGNWALYIANSSGNIAQIAANQPGTSFTFNFSVPTSSGSYPDGGGYRFRVTAQGNPSSIWCESSQFYISNLPTLTMNLNTASPLIAGNNATVSWTVSGGVPGLSYGGWTGNIRLQWYQNSSALSNLAQIPVSNNNYTFTVPTSISGGSIPGSNFRIAGATADAGTSIPPGYVYAFTSYFSINLPPPPNPPTLTYPPNGSTTNDLTPDLAWNNVSGAFGYEGQISLNSGFTSIVEQNTNIQSNNWTPLSLTQYTTYYWRIRTKGSGGTFSNWSSIWSFTIANTPVLITPTNGSTINTSTINFQWSDCNAQYYELLVDNNSGFGSPEISKNHLTQLSNYTQTSFQISGNWLEENVYYWKVYAVYSGGLRVQSSVGSFTYSPTKSVNPNWIPIYRAYKPADVDHFYCTSVSHLYQAMISGYDFEKIDGYLSLTPFEGTGMVSIFRFYDSTQKSHIYTANPVKKDSLISASVGNKYEGISGYAYGSYTPGMVKLYNTHLYNSTPSLIDHFYTISDVEKNNSLSRGYTDRGFIAYVSPFSNDMTEPWMDMQPEIGYGINPKNGNVGLYNKTSYNIPGARTSLNFTHIYNSLSSRFFSQVNSIGAGWSHSYMATLSTLGGRIYIVWPGGGVHRYNVSDLKPVTKGVYDILTKVSSTVYTVKKKDQFVYTFEILNSTDSTAFLKTIQDRNNNTITCNYINAQRKLTSITSQGRTLFFSYNIPGKPDLISEVTDPLGRSIRFLYDNDNNLIRFTDAKNQITQYQYIGENRFDHLLKKVIYPKGILNSVENIYDSTTKKVTFQRSGNTSQFMSFLYNSNSTTIIDEHMRQFTFSYYSPNSDLITSLTRGSVRDSFVFNDSQNPVKPTRIIDGRGYVTTISYDTKGNPLQINKPENAVHKFFYNSFNDVTQYIDPRNKSTNYSYNGTGNLTGIQTPRGSTGITYNSNGTINNFTDPMNRTSTFTYNSYGNVATVTNNMNHQTSYIYDAASRMTSYTDANLRETSYLYDQNDNVTRVSKPASNFTNYSYDANDNLYTVSDPNSQTTTFNHNDKDLLASVSNPTMNQTSFDYHDNGMVRNKQKPDFQSVMYTYDNSSRLLSISGSITGSFGYDNSDNLTSAGNQNGSIVNNYDGLNRITSSTDYYGNTVSYGYDPSGNIISITYPGNKLVQYTYYDDNLMQSVRDWNNNLTSYTYRNDGSLLEVIYPNGTKKTFTYDAAGRMTGISNRKGNGTVINEYNFTLDNVGNHTSVSQTEPLNVPPILSSNKSYTYNSANRLLTDGIYTYSYDANGNLIHKFGSDTVHYGYDAENRLTNISGKYTAGFTYDVAGNRRSSNISGTIKKYVLDINTSLPRVLMETDNNGNVLNYYVYGLELVSRIKPNNSTEYYHTDYRGSVIAMTDVNQTVTNKYSYGTFGEVLQKFESSPNPFTYVGGFGVMDEGVGLYFMRARFYDPNTGRFVSEDPVWDVNLYPYADNNPISMIDPDGNLSMLATKLFKYATNIRVQKIFFKHTGIEDKVSNYVYNKWFSPESGYYYSEESDKKIEKVQNYLYAISYSIQFSGNVLDLVSSGKGLNKIASLNSTSQLKLAGYASKFFLETTYFIVKSGFDIAKFFGN